MPLVNCTKDGKPGYKYGEGNKSCFTYTEGNEASRKEAKRRAILQGTAIAQSTGEKLQLSKDDITELCKDFDVKNTIKMDKILVKSDENNLIFGWAYVRETKEGKQVVDYSDEFIKAENFGDLELATYAYNLAYRQADRQHDLKPKGYLVESLVFTKEKMEKMGIPEGIVPEAVWMGFYFPDDKDYEEIKQMTHPMFSLYGSVTKEFVEDSNMLKDKGLGRMGGSIAGGPGGKCVCPKCGTKVAHKISEPCYDISCPKCGSKMTREEV